MSSLQRILVVMAIVMASVFGMTWITSAQVAKPAELQKWEYKMVVEPRGEAGLNNYGMEGWELVAVNQEGRVPTLYFKRPKISN
jgi:hypothetical protein